MTSTELARMDTAAIAVLDSTNEGLHRLGQWVQAARSAHELVAPLIDTAFVPDAYRPRIEPNATAEQVARAREVATANATAAVLQGITLGIDPLTALAQIYIVHGRPGLYADMMVALVQAHGHEVWDEDLSDTRAVVCGRRKGTERIVRITVTMDQARKAGWTSNQAYGKTPQDMLWARAAGRVCKRIASDVLKGIASVEEIRDTIATTAEVGNGTRTVARQRPRPAVVDAAVAVEDPPLQPDTSPEPAAQESAQPAEQATQTPPTGPGITAAQSKKLHAELRELDLGDRPAGLSYITDVVGRLVESTKDLTRAEVDTVLAYLAVDKAERAKAQPAPAPAVELDQPAPAVQDDQPPLEPDA